MPDGVIAWVKAFCDHHHVDEPFKKRKRKEHDPNDAGFSRRPDHGVPGDRMSGAPRRGDRHGQT